MKYILVINDWPVKDCRKIRSFDNHEEAVRAADEFIAAHDDMDNKVILVYGKILSIDKAEGI